MAARRTFNPKREMQDPDPALLLRLQTLAPFVRYVGSPLHKRNPGDFGLTPPAAPRQGKTLCDNAVTRKSVAQNLLEQGLRLGFVSMRHQNGWPQNIWAVHNGIPLEAQLDNAELGTYHGYPMGEADPLRQHVLARWNAV